MAEISRCFTKISEYFSEEERLLLECHERIHPHAANMDITRKRLNLLVAAVDARMTASAEKPAILNAYSEALALLQDWEGGVPLDQQGAEVLERCLRMLERAGQNLFENMKTDYHSDSVVEGEAIL